MASIFRAGHRKWSAFAGVALACVFAGVVFAGTGVGGTFQLGVNNTIGNYVTSLTAVASGATSTTNALQIINNATTGSGRALYLLSKTLAPVAYFQNTIGPGLQIAVPAGKAPILVPAGSSTATNLSADRLDGLDNTAFQRRVTGSCPEGQSIRVIGSTGTVTCQVELINGGAVVRGQADIAPGGFQTLIGDPVYGDIYVAYICPSNLASNGTWQFGKINGNAANVFVDNGLADPLFQVVGPTDRWYIPARAASEHLTIQSQAEDTRTYELNSIHRVNDCHAQATAVIAR